MLSTLGWVFASLFLLAVSATRTYYAYERRELIDIILFGAADLLIGLATILFWAFPPKSVGSLPIFLVAFGVIVLVAGGALEASGRARRLSEEARRREAEFLRQLQQLKAQQPTGRGQTGPS